MIFLTVGTQFGFDRLVKAVDETVGQGVIAEEVFAQIGSGEYEPRNIKFARMLEKEDFDTKLAEASAVISHAGIGTITTAINLNKPVLAMPRLKGFGELVNDHQLHTARKFEQLGHILAVYSSDDLPAKIELLKHFVPKVRENQVLEVVNRIKKCLDSFRK